MQSRRSFLIKVGAGFAAAGLVVVGTVIADELLGVITKVDVEGKKLTVVDADDKEVEIKVTDDTEIVTKDGTVKVDLEKVNERVTKAQDAGRKGSRAKIFHDKNVATKIEYQRKKKAE